MATSLTHNKRRKQTPNKGRPNGASLPAPRHTLPHNRAPGRARGRRLADPQQNRSPNLTHSPRAGAPQHGEGQGSEPRGSTARDVADMCGASGGPRSNPTRIYMTSDNFDSYRLCSKMIKRLPQHSIRKLRSEANCVRNNPPSRTEVFGPLING